MSIIDQVIVEFDKALRTSSGTVGQTRRLSPASSIADSELSDIEQKKSASVRKVQNADSILFRLSQSVRKILLYVRDTKRRCFVSCS